MVGESPIGHKPKNPIWHFFRGSIFNKWVDFWSFTLLGIDQPGWDGNSGVRASCPPVRRKCNVHPSLCADYRIRIRPKSFSFHCRFRLRGHVNRYASVGQCAHTVDRIWTLDAPARIFHTYIFNARETSQTLFWTNYFFMFSYRPDLFSKDHVMQTLLRQCTIWPYLLVTPKPEFGLSLVANMTWRAPKICNVFFEKLNFRNISRLRVQSQIRRPLS